MSTTPAVAVVIPAYNEAATIADIARRTLAQGHRVIVVDDASSDATAAALDGLAVTLLRNPHNLGKGASLRRGAAFARSLAAEVIITLDGDGQHRPEEIPRLLAVHARAPAAIVVAARLHDRAAAPPLRRFANAMADFWISWAAGQRILDSQSGFRLYPAELFAPGDSGNSDDSGFVFESEILIDAAHQGRPIEFVAIDTIYQQQARASHYRPTADTLLIIRMVALRLLRKGFYPRGLYHVLTDPRPQAASGG